MSDIKQNIRLDQLALNTDESMLHMPNGSSPYNLNILVGEDGLNGVVTNMKGNVRITYDEPLTLSNTYFVLGSYYNVLTRVTYFFIFSQPYDSGAGVYLFDNRLLRFNEDTQTIDTIFLDTKNYFELDPAQHLTNMKMLGDWLFFNPVTSQPKMIDVVMAYNYTYYDAWDDSDPSSSAVVGNKFTWRGGLFVANQSVSAGEDPTGAPTKWDRIGDCYQNESTVTGSEFNRAFFAIKPPPADRIAVTYGSDSAVIFNNVEGLMFRFCHRYQYFDNTYSVCSAHSNVTLPIDNELYNGSRPNNTTRNNYINLSFSLYSAALVKNVEILFQEIGHDWKRAAVIYRQDQTLLDTVDYTYSFYNNEAYPVIEQTVPYRIYDAVPRIAATQEIINENVLCFAGCKEGFNNLDKDLIDTTLTATIVQIGTAVDEGTIRRDNAGGVDITDDYVYDEDAAQWSFTTTIDIGLWFAFAGIIAGDIYKIDIDGYVGYSVLGAGDVDTAVHLANALAALINSLVGGATTYAAGATVEVRIFSNFKGFVIDICRVYALSATATSSIKQGGFKTGAYHPYCLYYYDGAFRRGDAQVTPDLSVYVPSVNDYSPPITGTDYRWQIGWSVSHAPPSWAKYWRWGYAGNSRCSYFVQYIIESVAAVPDPIVLEEDVANTVKIDLTPLQTIRTTTETGWNAFPNSTIPAYEFSEGDRIRFMTVATVPGTPGTTLGNAIDGIFDFEILKFDAPTNMAYVQTFDYAAASIGINTLVEIYTPIKETDVDTYYEFGNIMPIIKDSGGVAVHSGITQNQSITATAQAATGIFSYGDVYHIMRTPSKPLNTVNATGKISGVFHESMWWSDFYVSNDWSRGKLGIESTIGEVDLNIVRYSNVYLQNTQVNGITTFEADKYKELNDVFGKIIAIVEVGDTLKVYQEKKPSSILIGRTEYTDTSGSGNVVVSSATLGAIRYSTTNYGTIFPESLSKNNRYVYGFDIYNGVMWRDSANGLFPISGRYADVGGSVDYKMMSYFKSKSKALLASGVTHCHVMSVWDEEYKMLYVTFKDLVNESNNDTVVFHEPSDRWVCFTELEYTPAEGYNQILELTYEILLGFDLGINFTFDYDTRFATFDIITAGTIETLYPNLVFIVDETEAYYIITPDGETYVIQD